MKSISKLLTGGMLVLFMGLFVFNFIASLPTADSYVEATVNVEERVVFAQMENVPAEEKIEAGKFDLWGFVRANAVSLFLAFLGLGETIARLTPTTKDDAWLGWVRTAVDALVPNFAKGGGRHPNK